MAAEALAVAAVAAAAVASPLPAEPLPEELLVDQKRLGQGGKRKRTLTMIEMMKESEMAMATTWPMLSRRWLAGRIWMQATWITGELMIESSSLA